LVNSEDPVKNAADPADDSCGGWGTPRGDRLPDRSVKLYRTAVVRLFATAILIGLIPLGCACLPDTRHRDVIHNPFPQLKRVAVLPFFNQSSEPTVDSDQVTESYYAALQAIPGFEVLPVGVARSQWIQYSMANGEPQCGRDFQRLAAAMGVEAVIVGSVTDFDPYYPPRMAMTVHWYAANPGFHPIPPGYGLPWGTEAEEQIPRRITREAEFELARSQLATQTPWVAGSAASADGDGILPTAGGVPSAAPSPPLVPGPTGIAVHPPSGPSPVAVDHRDVELAFPLDPAWIAGPAMPPDWPDSTDLIPDPPAPQRPLAIANDEPVLSQTRLYRGDDPYFTERLSDFVETGDDARPGGWQDYLKRSDDFVRFCCHLHITEMLEARGGTDQSDLILRWPLSRY
jgi:hypothetical protein